jgi:hypothetical protein
MPTRYYWHVRHGLTVNAAVRLNGITLHHGSTTSQDGITAPVDHFLQPGENVLEVEIRTADPTSGSAFFYAGILGSRDEIARVELSWPEDFPALPPPVPPFPTLQARPFVMPADHPRPVFMDAREERVPAEGTDETWAPIRALHAAFERGDADEVADLFASRAAELHRFHELADTTPAGARAMAQAMVSGAYEMAPLTMGPQAAPNPASPSAPPILGGAVYFRECAGGRAVQLLTHDGRPSILGRSRENPKQRFFFNPVLVREGGVYRIFG